MGNSRNSLATQTRYLGGRPQQHSRRDIVDGILYIIRAGGAWRMMPNDLPHWKTCYHDFRRWTKLGYWEQIHIALRDKPRLAVEKKPRPLRLSIVKAFWNRKVSGPIFATIMPRSLQSRFPKLLLHFAFSRTRTLDVVSG
jgi:transposase